MAVYSADRVMRLRLVLWIVVAIAALLAIFAALLLGGGEGDDRGAGVFAMVVAGVLLGSAGSALRLLNDDPGRGAKIASVVTAVLVVLSGLVLAGTWLAFLLPLLGLGLLFLALISDEPDGSRR
jgi:peptidoglycan/LPS O-acetylase OafA/YrhL